MLTSVATILEADSPRRRITQVLQLKESFSVVLQVG